MEADRGPAILIEAQSMPRAHQDGEDKRSSRDVIYICDDVIFMLACAISALR
jgi:hypothetical protein